MSNAPGYLSCCWCPRSLLFRSQGCSAAELQSDIATLELAAQKAYIFVCLSCARCCIVSRESYLLCWCRRCSDFSHLASETEHNNATEYVGNTHIHIHTHTQTNTHTTNHIAESLRGSLSFIHPSCDLQLFSYTQSAHARARTHCSHQTAHQMLFHKTQWSFCSLFPPKPQKNGKS